MTLPANPWRFVARCFGFVPPTRWIMSVSLGPHSGVLRDQFCSMIYICRTHRREMHLYRTRTQSKQARAALCTGRSCSHLSGCIESVRDMTLPAILWRLVARCFGFSRLLVYADEWHIRICHSVDYEGFSRQPSQKDQIDPFQTLTTGRIRSAISTCRGKFQV